MDEKLLKELKEIELEMLKLFISICKKNNLQYYLLGGTCLGAVRHKGFIPWDDDIDVGMPRGDFEKFLKIAQKELPHNIFVQTHKTDTQYLACFAKLRNSDTTFIEESVSNLKINHGIYIDVFPLDGAPKTIIFQKWFKLKKNVYMYRISKEYSIGVNNEEAVRKRKKSIVKRIINKILNIYYKNLEKTINKADKLFRKYDIERSGFVANHCGAWGEKEIVPKEIFGSGTKGSFEGVEVVLPQKYHEYLTALYGDYMTPPPPEKRVGHHYCTVIDTRKTYKYYIDERRENL